MVEEEVERRNWHSKTLLPPVWRDELLLTSSGVGHMHRDPPPEATTKVSDEQKQLVASMMIDLGPEFRALRFTCDNLHTACRIGRRTATQLSQFYFITTVLPLVHGSDYRWHHVLVVPS